MGRHRRRGSAREKGPSLKDRLVEAMGKAGRPLFRREVFHLAHVRPEEKAEARSALEELVREGRALHIKGSRYGLVDLMSLVTGRFSQNPEGFGFVIPEEKGAPHVFIPPRGVKGAVHGDRVVARIEGSRPKGPEGSIIRILERGVKRVVGTFRKAKRLGVVIPEDERLLFEVIIPKGRAKRARNGQAVVAEVDPGSFAGRNPEGRIIEVLGDPEDMAVQEKIVVRSYDLPHRFSKEALEEAKALKARGLREDTKARRDLTSVPFVTIDGADAKDFDDAVSVKKTRSGYTLHVAIADVSHYVPKGSILDEEALQRGTSVYFPGSVIPMLPEVLSNDLCSLRPHENRLALVAELRFDRTGRRKGASFYPAVIRSRRRYTYTEVKEILVDRNPDLIKEAGPLHRNLEWMAELAELLGRRRSQRGSIDFDLPEPQVVLGLTGELEAIVKRERNLAHQIIEEFMIAANEAVASFLSEREIPTLYRIHEEPDRERIAEFVRFVSTLGLEVEMPEELSPLWCKEVLSKAEGTPLRYVVNTLLLRSMKQAVYSPENTGHFGLASSHYLHFTSPIRRYPDLVVHRILKANRRRPRKRPVYTLEELEALGAHTSQRERVAMEAEREMIDRLKVRYMAGHVGETFEGIITSVTSFGFFVELKEMFVDGMVRLVDLADDYYKYDAERYRLVGRRSGRVYQIGQEVRVRLQSVNLARRHINFTVV